MREYAVAKTRAPVTLRLAGGIERSGAVFLPVEPVNEPTVNKLRALLAGPERFFPFAIDNGPTVVQNKDHLIWCRHDGPHGPVVEILCERRRMTLELLDGTRVCGDVVADGPPEQRRVLDCLNRSGGYLLVECSAGDYVVRREAIDRVPSAEQGEPRELDVEAFVLESVTPALVG